MSGLTLCGSGIVSHTLSTLELDGGEWSASHSGRCTSRAKACSIPWIGSKLCSRASLDPSEKKKSLTAAWNQNMCYIQNIANLLPLGMHLSDSQELVKYSTQLGEDTSDLQKALELMLGVPHRANDIKFISSIEGYHGNIHKLGRLLRHVSTLSLSPWSRICRN